MFAHYGAFYYKGDSMIYKVKSMKDIPVISSIFPQYVVDEASRIAEILDTNYNNYGMDGGYIVLIENERDTEELKRCIDYCSEPVELSRVIVLLSAGNGTGAVSFRNTLIGGNR